MNRNVAGGVYLKVALVVVLAAFVVGPPLPYAGADSGVPASVWSLKGNRGTNPDVDFLGTTDNRAMTLKTNSTPVLTLDSDGRVEVQKALLVHGDATVDRNLSVSGGLSAAGGLNLTGPLTLSGSETIGGSLAVSGQVQTASLVVSGTSTTSTLNVSGTTTTGVLTITGGADLAEPFTITGGSRVPPGSVLVIDDQNPGNLKLSDRAYDRRVAGVASGAGGIHPGLTLGQTDRLGIGPQVAVSGRVYCLATTRNGRIRPGDLLTTSGIPGRAMKATDTVLSQGAVFGKAMSSLDGDGLVFILVSLQ